MLTLRKFGSWGFVLRRSSPTGWAHAHAHAHAAPGIRPPRNIVRLHLKQSGACTRTGTTRYPAQSPPSNRKMAVARTDGPAPSSPTVRACREEWRIHQHSGDQKPQPREWLADELQFSKPQLASPSVSFKLQALLPRYWTMGLQRFSAYSPSHPIRQPSLYRPLHARQP